MIVGAQRAPLYNAGNPLAGHAIAFAIAFASLLLQHVLHNFDATYLRCNHVASTFAFVFVYPTISSQYLCRNSIPFVFISAE